MSVGIKFDLKNKDFIHHENTAELYAQNYFNWICEKLILKIKLIKNINDLKKKRYIFTVYIYIYYNGFIKQDRPKTKRK